MERRTEIYIDGRGSAVGGAGQLALDTKPNLGQAKPRPGNAIPERAAQRATPNLKWKEAENGSASANRNSSQ